MAVPASLGIGANEGTVVTVDVGEGVGSGSLTVNAKMLRLSTCAIAVDLPKSTSVASCVHAP